MTSKRPPSDTGRRPARSHAAQAGTLATRVAAPVPPAVSRIRQNRSESAEQRLSGLEALRRPLVQAVMDARELCERTAEAPPDPVVLSAVGSAPLRRTPTFGQLLLCAAVKDLEELDDRLYQARGRR